MSSNQSIPTPESGEFCYQSPNGEQYIRLNLNKGEVKGTLINLSEDKPLVRDFTGSIVPGDNENAGTHMHVTLSQAGVSVDQSWHVVFEEDGIRIKYDIHAPEFTSYTPFHRDSFAHLSQRFQPMLHGEKNKDFIVPKGEPLCFDSIRNPKWIYMKELMQFWILDGGEVKGRGAGFDAASPWWNFEFYGTLDKGILNVKVHRLDALNSNLRIMNETWTIDLEKRKIYIKNHPNTLLSVWEYDQIENKGLIRAYFSI